MKQTNSYKLAVGVYYNITHSLYPPVLIYKY